MEQYNVLIIALKEILEAWTPFKLSMTLVLVVLAYRLPEIITALRLWKD